MGIESNSNADVQSAQFSLGRHARPFYLLVPHMCQKLVEFLSSSRLFISASYVVRYVRQLAAPAAGQMGSLHYSPACDPCHGRTELTTTNDFNRNHHKDKHTESMDSTTALNSTHTVWKYSASSPGAPSIYQSCVQCNSALAWSR